MSTTRRWQKSKYSRTTEVYVEIAEQPGADGMPRTESKLLAAVMPEGMTWGAVIWPELTPHKVRLAPQLAKETAMQSVIDYFQQHELPCSPTTKQP